jgi:hypothetical protein
MDVAIQEYENEDIGCSRLNNNIEVFYKKGGVELVYIHFRDKPERCFIINYDKGIVFLKEIVKDIKEGSIINCRLKVIKELEKVFGVIGKVENGRVYIEIRKVGKDKIVIVGVKYEKGLYIRKRLLLKKDDDILKKIEDGWNCLNNMKIEEFRVMESVIKSENSNFYNILERVKDISIKEIINVKAIIKEKYRRVKELERENTEMMMFLVMKE